MRDTNVNRSTPTSSDGPTGRSSTHALPASRLSTWLSVAWIGLARGFALFLGPFSLLNLAGDLRYPGFDASIWWIDLRLIGTWGSRTLLGATALLLTAYAVRPLMSRWRHVGTAFLTIAILGVCVANVAGFYTLAANGTIEPGCPIPFSLFVAAALGVSFAGITRTPRTTGAWTQRLTLVGAATVSLIGFPLAQMYCFGQTDYRRPADAVVVFGARVYANGRLSDALADRVRTACTLYHQGLAGTLVFSGGPGDGAIHETEAMRRMAIEMGVSTAAILVDEDGLNTQATVENTGALFKRRGIRTALAVSHFYHLPRIKLTYQRQGCEVYTVPAEERYRLAALPGYMAREVAALWVYYLRPLWFP